MKRTKIIFFSLFYILCLFVVRTVDVRADYIDPSVMTYAIQALAGVAIAVGTFFGLYWNRIKKTLLGSLAEGEKKKESDCLEFRDPGNHKVLSTLPEKELPQEEKKTNASFSNALLLCFALCFLLFFYTPLSLFFTNINEFKYDIYSFGGWIILMFLIAFILLTDVFFLFSKLGKKPFY